jgi:hypothetical protein
MELIGSIHAVSNGMTILHPSKVFSNPQEFCHLCTILWQSIPEDRKREIERAGVTPQEETNVLQTRYSTPCPTHDPSALEEGRNRNNEGLRIKIWEGLGGGQRAWHEMGHPIYMELYHDRKVLGRRIQLQEGKPFGSAVLFPEILS